MISSFELSSFLLEDIVCFIVYIFEKKLLLSSFDCPNISSSVSSFFGMKG